MPFCFVHEKLYAGTYCCDCAGVGAESPAEERVEVVEEFVEPPQFQANGKRVDTQACYRESQSNRELGSAAGECQIRTTNAGGVVFVAGGYRA